ncbi:xanthine phosphoribosyltransferase [uncultured Cetobacterium sp.]|uniref:xanthine phosphoribosyltransferase n=1 Tax=uncultured Cetobacterium sp. TaxID=527638 RepID=UPI0026086D9B|nr:xanthine phosphoribosyltransferase [uncultured Cetobacterium sp.]
MKLLKEYIEKYGAVTDSSILKVDSFINHQIDPILMMEIGEEFKNRFSDKKINKVLTIEASGIAIAIAVAYALKVPMVFAKKKKPSTMGEAYNATVHSFTKKTDYNITVSKEFLTSQDNVLIVDDFLAMGNAIIGLKNIVDEAGATVAGIGIAIEKGFQPGGEILKKQGLHLESLAIIDSLENNQITLR